MRIICWICIPIRKADFTPSFKVGNVNFFESVAATEGIGVNFGDGVADAHRSQASAASECRVADRGHSTASLCSFIFTIL